MDLNNILQYKIELQKYPSYPENEKYKFQSITKDNINLFEYEICKLIEYHHVDLKWNGIPTYNDVIKRILFGSKMDLWIKSDEVVGWHWYNTKCVTLDWKSIYQPLNECEMYGGSAFLSSTEKGFPSPAYEFYLRGMKKNLIDEKKDIMYLYIDSWNIKSIKLVEKVGMERFDFIK